MDFNSIFIQKKIFILFLFYLRTLGFRKIKHELTCITFSHCRLSKPSLAHRLRFFSQHRRRPSHKALFVLIEFISGEFGIHGHYHSFSEFLSCITAGSRLWHSLLHQTSPTPELAVLLTLTIRYGIV